jgi:hypothetical protein
MPLPPNGVIIYDGPSTITGERVYVVLTSIRGTSNNAKTSGDGEVPVLPLAQTYVIPHSMLAGIVADTNPSAAWFDNLRSGADSGACGACPLRPSAVQALKALGLPAPDPCYVLNGPGDVARAIVAGRYPTATLAQAAGYLRAMLAAGRIAGVRGGSWGDPAAAPFEVHAALHAATRGVRVAHPDGRERRAVWTCYTRTWAYAPTVAAPWRRIAMASAHFPAEARLALAQGWRPFTVVDGRSVDAIGDAAQLVSEGPSTHCPASNERGNAATCSTCGLCDGAADNDRRGPVTIMSHGSSNRSAAACNRAVEALTRMQVARRSRELRA